MKSTVWDETRLREFFQNCSDIKLLKHAFPGRNEEVVFLYCEGMAEHKQIGEIVLPALVRSFEEETDPSARLGQLTARLSLQEPSDDKEWMNGLFSGQLILFLPASGRFFMYDMEKLPKRTPSESATEISLKGPRDGFTEELVTNVALVRKRLRTPQLRNETFEIGTETGTTVSLLYLSHLADPNLIDEARHRLRTFRVNALLSSSQLEQALSDRTFSLFPLFDYIGRPDFIAQCLLRGRFAILVNGSPMALIAPSNLVAQLKSPEDLHFPYYFVNFEMLLRMIGLMVAIFLPGFWIGLVGFNIEQVPVPLLATVTISRLGLPLSAPLEALLMLGLFELFREAGIRLPRAVGQTIAVVGGLIVGDAAIRAGLTSPTMLVVSAVTAVATFTLVNQSLSGTVSVLRLYVLLCSSLFGMFGFFIGMFSILLYMSGLTSFGIGYLEPLSPVSLKDLLNALIDLPKRRRQRKADMLKFTNQPKGNKP